MLTDDRRRTKSDDNRPRQYIILHVYDKRLSEDEGEWSDEDEETKLEALQTKRLIYFFYSRE